MSSCRYIVGTLDLMVSEKYILVYLCAMAPRNKLPAIKWLHQCYTSIDRRYAAFTVTLTLLPESDVWGVSVNIPHK